LFRGPSARSGSNEVKYDGFRLRVERDGDRVRSRYPWIVEAALKNRQKRFAIDGEAVVLGVRSLHDPSAS
jgi:bifunctional non-homologous end joining protein LigD